MTSHSSPSALVGRLSEEEMIELKDLMQAADIAKQVNKEPYQRFFKRKRPSYRGKLRRLLSVLAKSPHTGLGMDVFYNEMVRLVNERGGYFFE